LPRIISIQFSTASKLYDFNAGDIELAIGDSVVVETERGLSIGKVLRGPVDREGDLPENLVTIKRKATFEDLATVERNVQREKEAYDFCLRRIVERSMQMKLVKVEYLFDGSKAVFFFTADGRVDFRDLVKDLAHTFHTRIEMRQIGVRD
jgi:cell fate regulator YaaT (PSP1 superfamily)